MRKTSLSDPLRPGDEAGQFEFYIRIGSCSLPEFAAPFTASRIIMREAAIVDVGKH